MIKPKSRVTKLVATQTRVTKPTGRARTPADKAAARVAWAESRPAPTGIATLIADVRKDHRAIEKWLARILTIYALASPTGGRAIKTLEFADWLDRRPHRKEPK